ncbi:MAG: HDOD domain-containing protein [Candidatus Thiodiazotropha sp. (ex Dulcina madagascariensis)]|nr:HDOD domain-containing protein [Candidatus Thiodiazotropha sp. (ex Dulcina madagascariensis)]MCU7927690.1 HDOD domain-containing protein [Candidatus Thiodiazotropha sp. (ex Dulcina madagascariensis)]
MNSATQATQKVLKLQHLPPLSATATRLLGMLSDDSFSLEDLARVINQDPALSARILGLANSAYFGQVNPIYSVEEAIIRVLGLNMVKSLAFSLAVSGGFETSRCRSFDLRKYWSHGLSIAMLSRQISLMADAGQRVDPDGVYLAGLLFDIGVLVLVHEFPEDYARVLGMLKQQSGRNRAQLEREIIGISSGEAGAWLIDRWHLPEMIVQVVAQPDLSVAAQTHRQEILLVGAVAEWVKNGFYDDHGSSETGSTLEDCCGLSVEKLVTIKTNFLRKEEEVSAIAGMLAK